MADLLTPVPERSEPRRPYRSTTRQRQAHDTRQRILAAGRDLFVRRGYAGTTLDAIASAAEVSPKTVVAGFGSKRGILAELLEPGAFGRGYQQILGRLQAARDPRLRVSLVAQLTRQAYEALGSEFALLRGAGAVAPELADLAQQVESRRRLNVAQLVAFVEDRGVLRRGMHADEATDVVWVLTSYDVYRMLVIGRGWDAERYVAWLADLLAERLLEPAVIEHVGR